jgi:hypothetical protein
LPFAAIGALEGAAEESESALLLALTNPIAGCEDEFNQWYSDRHLGEVLEIPGFESAQRFGRLDPEEAGFGDPVEHRYLALYAIVGDPAAAISALVEGLVGGQMERSAAANRSNGRLWVYAREGIDSV